MQRRRMPPTLRMLTSLSESRRRQAPEGVRENDSSTTVEIATKICFAVQLRLNPRRRNSSQLAEGSWSDASTPRLLRIA